MSDGALWLPEWEAALWELAERGVSSPAIAAELRERFGQEFTRHAVYRKYWQLHKKRASSIVETGGCDKPVGPPRDGGPRLTLPNCDSPVAMPGKPIHELGEWECHYEITGTHNRRAYRFCAEPVMGDKPYRYCEKHAAICYNLPSSNGRTTPFDGANRGSNPWGRTKEREVKWTIK